jgi:hypothetical protein
VNIVSYNPGHDGAIAQVRDGRLVSSIEAEKDSNWRYSPIGSRDLLDAFSRLEQLPDVVCTGGWWPREANPTGSSPRVGYRGIAKDGITANGAMLSWSCPRVEGVARQCRARHRHAADVRLSL